MTDLSVHIEGRERGEIRFAMCPECGAAQFPPRGRCASCDALGEPEWETSAGRGLIWSYCVFHKQYLEGFPTPYTVLIVELDEGVKVYGSLLEDGDVVPAVGGRVALDPSLNAAGGFQFTFVDEDKEATA